MVEVDCDGDCGSRSGVRGGADEEAVGCGYGPGEDLDYERGAFGFCGADYGDDLFEVVAGGLFVSTKVRGGVVCCGSSIGGSYTIDATTP